MIPIKYIRESFEKTAAIEISSKDKTALKVLGAISKLISGGARMFVKHPIASTLGAGAVVGGGVLAAKMLPGFTIINETRKRSLMKDQTAYLQQMAAASNIYGRASDINPQPIMQPYIAPLA